MRTKTLFIAAAALAAGIATSMAQSNVYSVNIVGYVNKPLVLGTAFISNPLDNGTNDLNSTLPGVPAKSVASFWTGSGFTTSTKGATVWSPNVATPPGLGFLVNSKSATTATFVGQVACQVGKSVTNALPVGTAAVGSIIPYSGDLNDTNINLLAVPAKSVASFWNGTGFTTSTKGATSWSPALPIAPADGWFINSKAANNWVQTLNP